MNPQNSLLSLLKGITPGALRFTLLLVLLASASINRLSAQDSYMPGRVNNMVADQQSPGQYLPDGSRYEGSGEGTYSTVNRIENSRLASDINDPSYFKMVPAGVPEITLSHPTVIPVTILNEESTKKFLGLKYIPAKAYVQLSPTDQYALVQMVRSDIPYAVYQSGFNEKISRVVVVTEDWKLVMKFDHEGILKQVTKKSR